MLLSDILNEIDSRNDPTRLLRAIVDLDSTISDLIKMMARKSSGGLNVDPAQVKLIKGKLAQLDRLLLQLSKQPQVRTFSWDVGDEY